MSPRIFLTYSLLLLTLAPFSANAGLILINDKKFDDKGDITVDLQTGIEWLDLTVTANRSYNDVQNDLSNEGGAFSPSDRWRYATMQEIKTLFSNTLAPDFGGGYQKITSQDKQVADFIGLFSDTFVDHEDDAWNISLNHGKPYAAGRSLGFYFCEGNENQVNFAEVNDGDFITIGPDDPFTVYVDDQLDSLDASTFYGDERQWRDYSSIQFGSWLVRDVMTVPESRTFPLLVACLSALFFIRNKKSKKSPRQ